MFNILMLEFDWSSGRASIELDRVFEYTDAQLSGKFKDGHGKPLFDQLVLLPSLLMEQGTTDQVANVGQLFRPRVIGDRVAFEFSLDNDSPSLTNSMIYANRTHYEMPNQYEFFYNHWAVKDGDLYRFLLQNVGRHRQRPTVFNISEHQNVDPALASVMIPFNANFDQVYDCISNAAHSVGLQCKRAKDIWEHENIIQEVVSLIDKSRIVICDCTDRNPNVFYEAGIAHTLGRDVILLTQNGSDIPFDVQHIRYIEYLNNSEGLDELSTTLQSRIETIIRK